MEKIKNSNICNQMVQSVKQLVSLGHLKWESNHLGNALALSHKVHYISIL